jgi:hypothetical protein
VPRGQRDRSLRPYFRFSRQDPLLFYQVAPQLYSRGRVDPVPDPLPFFFGSAGNRTRASGSVAKNSDHWSSYNICYKYKTFVYILHVYYHLCCGLLFTVPLIIDSIVRYFTHSFDGRYDRCYISFLVHFSYMLVLRPQHTFTCVILFMNLSISYSHKCY